MVFPAESLPDGSTLFLHHYTYGIVFALFGCAVVWDNYRQIEPVAVGLALIVGLLGFVFGWHTSPALGAIMSLIGPTVPVVLIALDLALGLRFVPWDRYAAFWGIWVVAWSLVALDDAVSHAFGLPTPLDHASKVLFGI